MKHAMDARNLIIAELPIRPGMLDEFLDYTVENLQISRSAADNLAFDILLEFTPSYRRQQFLYFLPLPHAH